VAAERARDAYVLSVIRSAAGSGYVFTLERIDFRLDYFQRYFFVFLNIFFYYHI
jgi:hypothetical protein